MQWWSLLLFALAVSIDGLGVGVSYGMRQMRIPPASILVICLTSTGSITLAMLAGTVIANMVTSGLAERMGAMILILVGGWILLQAACQQLLVPRQQNTPFWKVAIPSLGIAVQFLYEPSRADWDQSGDISVKEALVLGLALAMDAIAAGFGIAAASGFQWFVPLAVGASKFLMLTGGLWLGQNWRLQVWKLQGALVPGLILVILGVLKLFPT